MRSRSSDEGFLLGLPGVVVPKQARVFVVVVAAAVEGAASAVFASAGCLSLVDELPLILVLLRKHDEDVEEILVAATLACFFCGAIVGVAADDGNGRGPSSSLLLLLLLSLSLSPSRSFIAASVAVFKDVVAVEAGSVGSMVDDLVLSLPLLLPLLLHVISDSLRSSLD
jgi:hypothetical protein